MKDCPRSRDPYDLWATRLGVEARRKYYAGGRLGRTCAMAVGLTDWLAPNIARRVLGAQARAYPIVVAQQVLGLQASGGLNAEVAGKALACLRRLGVAAGDEGGLGWGLGFAWMSKNGLYPADTPFVTHTPYVMEALLALEGVTETRSLAKILFERTWGFLEELRVMHRSEDELAVSYSPRAEPRCVVNANAYAALAYGLHARVGNPDVRESARVKAQLLARWVARQQQTNGSWFYYADGRPGNFVDGFHSCFVVKNLRKVRELLGGDLEHLNEGIERGWRFIREQVCTSKAGLCRRFVTRHIRDPYRWDLYDQAEVLGLLVDFEEKEAASVLVDNVSRRFSVRGEWYCRIDVLGRRWGREFLRWGIEPWRYHSARLDAMERNAGRPA